LPSSSIVFDPMRKGTLNGIFLDAMRGRLIAQYCARLSTIR
jgi:hypothetical protein